MTEDRKPLGVHFTGSFPLRSAEEVFRSICSVLGDRVRRIPDGETGPRAGFVLVQAAVFADHAAIEEASVPSDVPRFEAIQQFALRPEIDPGEIEFEKLGYADAAKESYEVFNRLKGEGVIPQGVRFQVCIPTPATVALVLITAADRAAFEPAYEAAVLAEVDEIARSLPAQDLAIQWDSPGEMHILPDVTPMQSWWEGDVREGVVERLIRLGTSVPEPIELGYHLCLHHRERSDDMAWIAAEFPYAPREMVERGVSELEDVSHLVAVAGALCASVPRQVNFIHMPLAHKASPAYLGPLAELSLSPGTELYLGGIYASDGAAGTRRRIRAAQDLVPEFGVATDCGWGPRDPDAVPELLELHRAVSAPVEAHRR